MSAFDPAWEAWFDSQYDLRQAMKDLLDERLKGKPKPFRVAVYAALLEWLAEDMRMDIDLPEPWKVKP